MPSAHEYCAIGDTTTRFLSVTPRSVNGVNIGGTGGAASGARRANQFSIRATNARSRSRRFSCEMRWLRVSRLYANCGASNAV